MNKNIIFIVGSVVVIGIIAFVFMNKDESEEKPDSAGSTAGQEDQPSVTLTGPSGPSVTSGTTGPPTTNPVSETPPPGEAKILDLSKSTDQLFLKNRAINLMSKPNNVSQINGISSLKNPFSGLLKGGNWESEFNKSNGTWADLPYIDKGINPSILNTMRSVYNINLDFHKDRWEEQLAKITGPLSRLPNAGLKTTIIPLNKEWVFKTYWGKENPDKRNKAKSVVMLAKDAQRFYENYKQNAEFAFPNIMEFAKDSLRSEGYEIINE